MFELFYIQFYFGFISVLFQFGGDYYKLT